MTKQDLQDVPRDMVIKELILSKRLQSGFYIDVYLVMRNGIFESALFINDKYKAGPPIPHPLDRPTEELSHFMGVRPSVGLTPEEAERITAEVEGSNNLQHRKLNDRWGKVDED